MSNSRYLSNLSGLNGLDSISGTLYLVNNTILENFTGLENLVSIGGGLAIGQPLYGGSGNPALISLSGLDNLDTIGGGIYICYNESLSVCDVPFICDYLANPSGNIEIHDNASGCDGILEVAYHCGITYPCLTEGTYNFYGQGDINYFALVYPGCSDLDASINIKGYNIINLDSLNVITSINGNLMVSQTLIPDFSGLENLSFISGDFEIGYFDYWWGCFGNPDLVDFTGLRGLDSIGGDLQIECNSSLTSLAGLENLDAGIIEELSIRNNSMLSECAVRSVCDYLALPNAEVTIIGNADGCKSIQEVEQACINIHIEEGKTEMEQFIIYPNPVSISARLRGIYSTEDCIHIYIFNMLGTCLKQWQFAEQPDMQQEFTLDLNDLPPGIYIIRVQTSNEWHTKKVVKR